MIKSILIVCAGNICRSPFGEALLQKFLPEKSISSGGLICKRSKLQGENASYLATKVALEFNINLREHKAKQVSVLNFNEADLILVMEQFHKDEINRISPEFSDKVLLFSHWAKEQDIQDPYMKSEDFYRKTFTFIESCAKKWAQKIS